MPIRLTSAQDRAKTPVSTLHQLSQTNAKASRNNTPIGMCMISENPAIAAIAPDKITSRLKRLSGRNSAENSVDDIGSQNVGVMVIA